MPPDSKPVEVSTSNAAEEDALMEICDATTAAFTTPLEVKDNPDFECDEFETNKKRLAGIIKVPGVYGKEVVLKSVMRQSQRVLAENEKLIELAK